MGYAAFCGEESPFTKEDIENARKAARALSRNDHTKPIRLEIEGSDESIIVPEALANNLMKLLTEAANGNAVTIVPSEVELTTNQAASLLNVSRPHLIKILDKGDIPFRMVGTHRKIAGKHVMSYKAKIGVKRDQALDHLSEITEECGLREIFYDPEHD